MTATVVDPSILPDQAKKAIVSNVTNQSGPWVLINLATSPPSVVPSKALDSDGWAVAIQALEDASEEI
jgi:hypothetical protein